MTHNIYNKGDWIRFYSGRYLVIDEVHSIGKTEIGSPFARTLAHGAKFFDDIVECRAAPSSQEPNKKPARTMPLSAEGEIEYREYQRRRSAAAEGLSVENAAYLRQRPSEEDDESEEE
jgi:hypothetical protein